MPLTTHPLPFGLRDVALKSVNSSTGATGAKVDLPVARTFSFSESEDFEELQGDDITAGSHGKGPVVEWSLESGGFPFVAFQIMAGGTITDSGTTPAQKKVFSKLVTDARPYFQAEGQAISDSGGDVHGVVYRCKADGSLEGEMGNGAFMLLAASGKGYGDTVGLTPTNKLYDFVQNETAVAIT
jgi:hypothetical protein